jgi:hypothetical protein
VEKGLKVSLAAVVDVDTETSYALLAEETFTQKAQSHFLNPLFSPKLSSV